MSLPRKVSVYALVLLLAVISSGAPLGIVQVIANVSMILSYSQESGLQAGIQKTFSGKNPCKLCRFVERVQATTDSETSRDATVSGSHMDFRFVAMAHRELRHPHGEFAGLRRFHVWCRGWYESPPSPPPRPV